MKIDLHMHSTASDGKLSPKELVDWAVDKGVKAIAITDHDIVDGCKEAIKYAKGKDVEVVSGIEVGAESKEFGVYDIHIVGLFLDLENEGLLRLHEEAMRAREIQKKKIIEKLNELGYDITFEELKAEAKGINYGRPHIARVLMRKYPDEFTIMQDVFDSLLDYFGAAYVEQECKTIKEVVDIIHDAGGVAILAHPMIYKNIEKIVDRFVEVGGDGIEVDCSYSGSGIDEEEALRMIARAREIAEEKGLLVSGGVDFHCKNGLYGIGEFGVTNEEFEALKRFVCEKKLF